MTENTDDTVNLTQSLQELEGIVEWFDEQEEVDVEQGLTKVKAAAKLIKDSKSRLAAIENEFAEIEKEIGEGDEPSGVPEDEPNVWKSPKKDDDEPVDLSEIPF